MEEKYYEILRHYVNPNDCATVVKQLLSLHNVSQQRELLKDEEDLTFKQWIKANGYYKKGFEWFNKHGYSRDFDKLKKYYELRDCL